MLGTVLVATICVADPKTFECVGPERDISAAIEQPIKYCEMQSQALLAQMLQAFPNNRVTRYKCVVDNGHKKLDI